MRRDQIYTSATDEAGRVPPVVSWHQRTSVVVIASTCADTPAACGCGRSVSQARGRGSSRSNVTDIGNAYLDPSSCIVVIVVVVLIYCSMEGGQIPKGFGIVAVQGWAAVPCRFGLPFGWIKIWSVGMIVCGYPDGWNIGDRAHTSRRSRLEYRSRGGRSRGGRGRR